MAWAPNTPKATQRTNIANCRRIAPPYRSHAVFFDGALSSPLCRRLARKKPLSLKREGIVGRGAAGEPQNSGLLPGFYVDPCRRAADRHRQGCLQCIKKFLYIPGAEAAADPQCGGGGIANDDAHIGIALHFDDGVGETLAVKDNRAFAPGKF